MDAGASPAYGDGREGRAGADGRVAGVGGLAVVTSPEVVTAPWPFVDWPTFAGRGQQTTDRTLAGLRAGAPDVDLLADVERTTEVTYR